MPAARTVLAGGSDVPLTAPDPRSASPGRPLPPPGRRRRPLRGGGAAGATGGREAVRLPDASCEPTIVVGVMRGVGASAPCLTCLLSGDGPSSEPLSVARSSCVCATRGTGCDTTAHTHTHTHTHTPATHALFGAKLLGRGSNPRGVFGASPARCSHVAAAPACGVPTRPLPLRSHPLECATELGRRQAQRAEQPRSSSSSGSSRTRSQRPSRSFYPPTTHPCCRVWLWLPGRPLRGAFVCPVLAVALRVRPVPVCPLAPHAAPQTAAAPPGPLCPSACGFLAVVRGSGWLAVPIISSFHGWSVLYVLLGGRLSSFIRHL